MMTNPNQPTTGASPEVATKTVAGDTDVPSGLGDAPVNTGGQGRGDRPYTPNPAEAADAWIALGIVLLFLGAIAAIILGGL